MVKHMAGKGGYMPGGGRPKGSLNKKTQELIVKATEAGITPIEVLLHDMRYFHNLGENKMRAAEQTDPGKKQSLAFKAACALKDIARSCAVSAAPYIHPKLASIDGNINIKVQESRLAFLD